MKYYISHLPSGEIISTISVQDEVDPPTTEYGWKQTEFSVSGHEFKVINNNIVEYSEQGKIRKSNIPNLPAEWDPTTETWINKATTAQMWDVVKQERAKRLVASDWTQLPDVPLQTKELWAAYRQQLRDITKQPDPLNIVWPQKPV